MCMGELLGRALFVVGGRRRRGRHWRAEWRALLYLWSLSAVVLFFIFFFSSRRRHTRCSRDWSSDVCSSDLKSSQMTQNSNLNRRGQFVSQFLIKTFGRCFLCLTLFNELICIYKINQEKKGQIGRASCRERV